MLEVMQDLSVLAKYRSTCFNACHMDRVVMICLPHHSCVNGSLP